MKPKKGKRAVIKEKEYEDLVKLNARVARLESLIDSHLLFMGGKEDVYSLRADPVFALKAGLMAPPLKINEGLSSPPPQSSVHTESSKRDKGKSKMFVEDSVSYEDALMMPSSVQEKGGGMGLFV